jgi:hypothetical protein
MPPRKKSNKITSTVIVESVVDNSLVQISTNPPNNLQSNLLQHQHITQTTQPNLQLPLQSTTQQEDDKKNKRRGRKPKDKFNIDDAYTEQNNSLLDFDNNIIIKLPIACKDLESELTMATDNVLYNPILTEPKPFNECENSNYETLEQYNNTIDINNNTIDVNNITVSNNTDINTGNNTGNDNLYKFINESTSNNFINQKKPQQYMQVPAVQTNYMDYYQNKINDLLSDIDDSASKKRLTQIEILLAKKYKTAKQIDLLHNLSVSYDGTKWPSTSNICCFWCCHNFTNTPWGIPKKYTAETGIFTMYGIFCSPNCVLAHLLRHEANNVNLWEQVSLLNLLHYKIYETDENIVPAPDNICLKMFGGPLNIQEFRALTLKNEKKYSVNFPPCVIITPVLEETKKIFNQDSYYIPIDKKRINKIQSELKIKRTNNVYKNSLENVMNISYTNQ